MTLIMVLVNLGLGLVVGTLVTPESQFSEWASVFYIWVAGYLFGEYHFSYRNDFPWTIKSLRSKFKIVRLKKNESKDIQLRSPPQQLRKIEARRIPKAGTDA